MTSPITHENIIEVLRAIIEDDDAGVLEYTGLLIPIRHSSIEAARDLYQRLQAEKEGGWQPIDTAPSEWPGSTEEVLADLVRCIDDDYRYVPHSEALLRARLKLTEGHDSDLATGSADDNSELGKAVERILSRQPASGTDSSGRATADRHLEDAQALILKTIGEPTGLITLNMHHHLRQAIATVLASEFDRGRRSGIEQAAETAEDTDYHGKIPLGWTLAVNTAADKIRALLTNPEKTI